MARDIPGFLFIDHVAIAVPSGTLDEQVAAYALLGFREIHRETAEGSDRVREALLQIGDVWPLQPSGDRCFPIGFGQLENLHWGLGERNPPK